VNGMDKEGSEREDEVEDGWYFCRILLFCNSCLGARRKLSFIWNTLFIILPYILPPYNWKKKKKFLFFFSSCRKCVFRKGGGEMGEKKKTQSQPRQRAPSSSCVPSLLVSGLFFFPSIHPPFLSVISSLSHPTLSLYFHLLT
jgi:hypothetical protein